MRTSDQPIHVRTRGTNLRVDVKNTSSALLSDITNSFRCGAVEITRELGMLNKGALVYES